MPANRPPGGFTGSGDPRINHAGPFGKLPVGFSRLLREAHGDGAELRDFAMAVLRADVAALRPVVNKAIATELAGRPDAQVELILASVPSMKDRLEALKFIKGASYGKDLPTMPADDAEAETLNEQELFASIVDLADEKSLRLMQERILARQRAEGAQQ